MSVRPSAKPIVRRQSAATPPSKVLLTIPDFRDAKSAVPPQTHKPVAEQFDDSSDSARNATERDDVLESLEMAVAYQEATGSHPLGTQLETGFTDSTAVKDESFGSDSSSGVESKRRRKSFDAEALTQEAAHWFSKNIKQNLGILGTIAASIVVCTLVARAMKHESAPRELVSNEPNSELNDVVPASANAAETITAVTPDFEPTQLQPQAFPQQANRQADPRRIQAFPTLERPANMQPNNLQNQTSASPALGQPRSGTDLQQFSARANVQQDALQGQENSLPRLAQSPTGLQPIARAQTNIPSQKPAGQPATDGGINPFDLPAFGGQKQTAPQGNIAAANQVPPQVATFQSYAQQEQQNLRQQPPQQQTFAAVPPSQQPTTTTQYSRPQQQGEFRSATQMANQPTAQPAQPKLNIPMQANVAANPYPTTGQATLSEIAADLQNMRSRETQTNGLPVNQAADRFSNSPSANTPAQFGRTADRENTQGYDARFGVSPAGTNTGVFR